MPVIPIPEGTRRVVGEDFQAREGEAYRKAADEKLKQLQNVPMTQLGQDEPLPFDKLDRPDWMKSGGYDTPDFTSTAQPSIVPGDGDPLAAQFEQDRGYSPLGRSPRLTQADIQGDAGPAFNDPSGVGGPENGGLSQAQIIDIRKRLEDQQASESDKNVRSRLLSDVKPDEAAKNIDLAERAGVTPLQVERNRKTYEAVDRAAEIDRLRSTAPKLRNWLDKQPENFTVSHDDTDNLGWWEQTGQFLDRVAGAVHGMDKIAQGAPGAVFSDKGIKGAREVGAFIPKAGGALSSGYVGISQGFWGIPRAASEINDQFANWITGRTGQSDVSKWLAERQAAAKQISDSLMPQSEDPTERGVLSGFQSLPPSAMAAIMSLMSAGTAPALIVMGGTTGGQSYGTARDQGMNAVSAAGYGMGQGLLEAGTEALPMHWLLGDAAKRTPFFEMLAKQALGEGVTEQVATASQDFLDWAVLPANRDKPITEYLAERGPAAYETLLATMVATGVQTTLVKAADKTMRAADDGYQQRRSEELARTFDAMGKNAGDSKLLKRLPEKYRELVNEVTKDGPLESVRIQPEAFVELAQSQNVTTDALAQAFRVDPNDINAAIASGEDVVIPSGNYAAAIQTAKKSLGISGETLHAALVPSMRLRADDFTAKERAAMKAVFEEEQKARTEATNRTQEFADRADRVREQIRQQVAGAGLFNTEAANTQAALIGEMVTTLAERTGQDPETLWKEQGFDVVAALTGEKPDEAALPQARPVVPLNDDMLLKASETLSPNEFEAWKAAHDGLSNEEIAARIGGEDATITPVAVSVYLGRAKAKGFEVAQSKTGRPKGNQTDAVVRMIARGTDNSIIAETMYPDIERSKAMARIRKVKHDYKDKIAELSNSLAQSSLPMDEASRMQPGKVDIPIPKWMSEGGSDIYAGGGMRTLERNPTAKTLEKIARDAGSVSEFGLAKKPPPYVDLRWIKDRNGNVYVGDANSNMHDLMADGLRKIGVEMPEGRGDAWRRAESYDDPRVNQAGLMRRHQDGRWEILSGDMQWKPFDPSQSGSSKLLAQDARGTFTPRALRSLIRLFESTNLSTLVHEAAHWYLDTLWKMAQTENPHPFVMEQIAAILEWQGKSPNWTAMFDAEGRFTEEGRDIQEAFAETFEAYLRDGKAPSTALRSVFATFKQWLLRIYKSLTQIGSRVKLNDEIRAVFDRMLATDEAIRAAQTGMARDSAAMAQELLKRGVITEKALERTTERLAAAKERAEAELMARLMEDYERSQKAWWRDEERQVRREVQSEIDERPEQRAYSWLSGKGWKDTREDRTAKAVTESEALRALEQAPELGFFESDATDATLRDMRERMVQNGIIPVILLFKTTSGRIIAFPGDTGQFGYHHDLARQVFGLGDLKLQHGVWNPAKWPTLEAMNASDQAWYDTTGTAEDTRARELAQGGNMKLIAEQAVKNREEAFAYFNANQDAHSAPLSRIASELGLSVQTADRLRNEWRRTNGVTGPRGRTLAQSSSENLLVYRGSAEDEVGVTENGRLGLGLYSAEDPEIGAEWGGITGKVEAWRIKGRLFDLNAETAQGLENYEKQEDTPAAKKLFARLKAEGYVGVRDPWSGHINVFDAKDMERVPGEDKELGTTWTNWVEDEMEAGSLAQSVQPSRQLDAMGFYSAAQESALRVPDNIWNMGWQAARNALAKGRDGIAPRRTEIEYLGLDAMFGDTKLKGADLKAAVLEHIAAKRLSLVENFARFDPNNRRVPTKLEMLEDLSSSRLEELLDIKWKNIGTGEKQEVVADTIVGFADGWSIREERKFGRYSLVRGQVSAEQVVATGTRTEMIARFVRTYFESNKAKIAKKLSKEDIAAHWEETKERNLVRGAGDIRLPGENVPLFEAVIGLPEGVLGSDYQAPRSHVGGKAKGTLVTIHGEERIDDKGQRTLFAGQVQSDMAQQAREQKEIDKQNEEIIRLSGIVDRKSALDYLFTFSMGFKREEWDAEFEGETDARLIDRARVRWASNNDKIYAGSGYTADQLNTDAPLLSTSEWTNVAVRSMIYRAARESFPSISFPTAETSEIIQGNDDAAQHYETNVKGALEKIAKQLGGEVRKGAVDFEGRQGIGTVAFAEDGTYRTFASGLSRETVYATADEAWAVINANGSGSASAYILDITPAMRTKIMSEGFPLFQQGDTKGRTAPPLNLPPMRLNLQAVKDQYGDQALAELPPEVAAFSAQANDTDQFLELIRDIKKTLKQKKPKSLWKFLSTSRIIGYGNDKIAYRGIRDDGGEILKIIGEKKAAPGLISDKEDGKRVRSYDIEQAATAAWEQGYFDGPSPPTPAVFLDALRADFDGQAPRYARTDIAALQQIQSAEQWSSWFDQNGIDIEEKDQAALRTQLETLLTSQGENAISPDEAAPFFRMADGKALLDGLKQGPMRDKLIREETNRRMIERHGDIFRNGTVMQEAQVYARNEIQQRQFEIELEALARATGQQAAGNLAKQQARENLRTKQVREVLNYNQWLTLEQRWGKKAFEAASKGDYEKAAEYARYRLVNFHMYVEGRKLADEVTKAVASLKAYDTKARRIILQKAGSDFVAQMDQLLGGYEFINRPIKVDQERQSLREWFAQKTEANDPLRDMRGLSDDEIVAAQQEEIERSAALAAMYSEAQTRNYKSLTVEEFLGVRDRGDMIWRLAKNAGKLLGEHERRLIGLAAGDIAGRVAAVQPKKKKPESFATFSPKEMAKRGRIEYMSELRTLQSIIRTMDGGEDGLIARYLVNPLNGAWGKRIGRMNVEQKAMAKLFKDAYGSDLKSLRGDKQSFAGVDVPLALMERLTVAIYWGTEISRRRVMDGFGWDEQTVNSILGSLTEKDWRFVQSVWDYVDSFYPEANKAHLDVHHVPITKQEALPIVTRFGIVKGGYYPLVYDPYRSSRAGQKALEADAKQITGRVGTRTTASFTQARSKGRVTMPLLLDMSITLPRHVDDVVASFTTQRALLDAGKLLVHPEVEAAIVDHYGRPTYRQLLSAMRDARNGPERVKTQTERNLVRLRNGATVVGLGLNIKTAIFQLFGHTNSLVRLGGKNLGAVGGVRWLLAGLYRMGVGAQGMQNGLKFIVERSDYMRNRRMSQNRELADLRTRIEEGRIKGTVQRVLEQSSMFFITTAQYYGVDAPLWLGAYEKALNYGASEEAAIASADQTVIDAQGAGEIYQLAGIQRGSPLLKLFTNFASYAVTTWNLGVQRTVTTNFKNPAQALAWAVDMFVLMSVPAIITTLATNAMMGGGDDDEPLEEQLTRAQISFLLQQLGLFGQLGSAVSGYGYTGPQGTRAFADASKAIEAGTKDIERLFKGEPLTGGILRPLNLAMGAWWHYPAAALDRFVRGADAMMKGETDDPKALLVGPPRE